jgi:hypothetical protein
LEKVEKTLSSTLPKIPTVVDLEEIFLFSVYFSHWRKNYIVAFMTKSCQNQGAFQTFSIISVSKMNQSGAKGGGRGGGGYVYCIQ